MDMIKFYSLILNQMRQLNYYIRLPSGTFPMNQWQLATHFLHQKEVWEEQV